MRKIKYNKAHKTKHINLEYTGKHHDFESQMQLFVYDDDFVKEYANFCIDDLEKIDASKNNWLNLHGLNNIEIIESIGEFFKIDDFILSDILNTSRRTKLEESSGLIFFNIKSLLSAENSDVINVEQISFLIKKGVLISFQEKKSDFFTHIRERLRGHHGIIRTKKPDYLLYMLLDAIMENFYITIENEEDKIEDLINITKTNSDPEILIKIEKHRDNLNFLKRSIIPLRDSLFAIKSLKEESHFESIEKENFGYFSRLHQKSLELLEQIDSDLGMLESASNFYFSSQSHKMNEIMKILTIVSAIFIPMTVIVGIYGMNFQNIPELKYKYGYFTVISIMLIIGFVMVMFFRKKKWL